MQLTVEKFKEGYAQDVSGLLKEKGPKGFSYLSWPYAVKAITELDPTVKWSYETETFGNTVMVYCELTALGKTIKQQLPVMDFNNRAITNPTSVDVNKTMQRALVKAVATLSGIGLPVYAGEDYPEITDGQSGTPSDTQARQPTAAQQTAPKPMDKDTEEKSKIFQRAVEKMKRSKDPMELNNAKKEALALSFLTEKGKQTIELTYQQMVKGQ